MLISDQKQRTLALDPAQSFIVQAPAGSGKTTLLVQRYLTLLAQAQVPEEIIAITFTRKAAFEMRDRVLAALSASSDKLIQAVLQRNQEQQWNLLRNPNRLRIQTIDSLCAQIVRQLPILARTNNVANIVQDSAAEQCYRQAAQALLLNLASLDYSLHLQKLLVYLDNNWQRIEDLLVSMLKAREQWLPHLVSLKDETNLRDKMAAALRCINQENLERCQQLFPATYHSELLELLEFAHTNAINSLTFLQHFDFKQNIFYINHTEWHGIAGLLLTKEFSWRQKITKEHGFPAESHGQNREEKALFKSMKVRMQTLLEQLQQHETLRQSLEDLLCSPPSHYSDNDWEIIAALLELLPVAAAGLKVLFQEQNVTDYAEISMAAQRALGNAEAPTDISLRFDYRLQHLLVDEFQDTSIAQLRLLEKLLTGWQPGDGRTLFLVGDPMQSIYRFRDAEVGLFLRAQQDGIGAVKLTPLTLTTNFRSAQTVVDWINSNCSKIFPPLADVNSGAVSFTNATATYDDPQAKVTVELLPDADIQAESERIVTELLALQQTTADATIAILVRARTHLTALIPALRAAHINFQAVELETLAESETIKDLFALTRALYHLGDRIAWLALLRAPWCGLELSDLHAIANGPEPLIWDNLLLWKQLSISTTGSKNIKRLLSALASAIAKRGHLPWDKLIEQTWLSLGGPAAVNEMLELEHAALFFELLAAESELDITVLAQQLKTLFVPPTPAANVQIMTIHKAKGLEFDHVIIPGINRYSRPAERKLLLWLERPQLHGDSDLLLAPLPPAGEESKSVYDYLRLINQRKTAYETGRLLYVAITRAKKSATLFGSITTTKEELIKQVKKGSLLEQLLPVFTNSWLRDVKNRELPKEVPPELMLRRLTDSWQLPNDFHLNDVAAAFAPEWQYSTQQEAIIGTVMHRCLWQISQSELSLWTNQYISKQQNYWRKLLLQLGCNDCDKALTTITDAVTKTINDPRGKWILSLHRAAASELAISTTINGKLENLIVDRTFVDNAGVRWIIDYKTSQPKDDDIDKFIASECNKYRPQILKYTAALTSWDEKQPIKAALYFPLIGRWQEIV